ncbi:MAG: hypothetical protein IJS26_03740 [Alphaproteobacteria bacterium]|nr:hypothetical protein [Alphaproteobacteria bacterium]
MGIKKADKESEGKKMRDSFVFYSSFAKAASTLGDKARLKLYDSVIKLGLSCAENVAELEQVCNEIEISLAQNRNAFAQFLLIKPQIIANFTRYLNGSKGAKYGVFGGAPKGNKNALKNNPKTTPNENVNVNENVNNFISSKDKSFSEIKDSAKAPNKKYAFEGKIIKLKQEDFEKWQKAFPDLNLNAELLQRDLWLEDQPPEVQKRWFMSTSQFFIKQNKWRKVQHDEFISNDNATQNERFYL